MKRRGEGIVSERVEARNLKSEVGEAGLPIWRRIPLELFALTAMVLIFFARFLFTGRIIMMRDLFCFWYPRYMFFAESIKAGVLPLWNPYTGCGEPHLANIESAVFYPPNLIFVFVPVGLAMVISVACHLLLMGAGVYILCRLWGVSRQGGLLAAVGFSFSSLVVARIEFYPFFVSLAWLPIVFVAFCFWLRRRTLGGLFLVSIAFCLQLLGGYPEVSVFGGGALGLYAVFVGVSEYREQRKRKWSSLFVPLLGLGAAGLVALLLSMAQLIPTWEAVRLSINRVGQVNPKVELGSANPLMVFTLLVPSLYGVPGYVGKYWAPSCYEFWLAAFYVGILPLVLLFTVIVRRVAVGRTGGDPSRPPAVGERIQVPFLLTLLILSCLYAMGDYTPFFGWVWHAIPILQKFRWPIKSLMCAVLSLSCLAGIGLDWIRRSAEANTPSVRGWRRFVLHWTMPLVCLGLTLLVVVCLVNDAQLGKIVIKRVFNLDNAFWPCEARVPWDTILRDSLKLPLILIASYFLLELYVRRRTMRHALGWLIVIVVFADLAATNSYLLPSFEGTILTKQPRYLGILRPEGNRVRFYEANPTQRIYGETDPSILQFARNALVGGWPMADKAFNIEPYGNFRSASQERLLTMLRMDEISPARKDRLMAMTNCDRIVRFPNLLEYYLSPKPLEKLRVGRVGPPLPPAYVVGGVKVFKKKGGSIACIAWVDFDPLTLALTERQNVGNEQFDDMRTRRRIPHSLTSFDCGHNEIKMTLESSAPGFLVVSETYYPGWEATVNGNPTPPLQSQWGVLRHASACRDKHGGNEVQAGDATAGANHQRSHNCSDDHFSFWGSQTPRAKDGDDVIRHQFCDKPKNACNAVHAHSGTRHNSGQIHSQILSFGETVFH